MALYKEIRPTYVKQKNGILRLSRGQASDAFDAGLAAEYSGKFSGLYRRAATGQWWLFRDYLGNPDTNSISSSGLLRGDLFLGALDATNANLSGALTASGAITSSGALTGASLNAGNLQLSANQIVATGNLSLIANQVLLPSDPTNALGAATKQYVDSVATGLDAKASCRAITTSVLAGLTGSILVSGAGIGKTITRGSNGSIANDAAAFDGVTLVVGNRVLVAREGSGSVGSASDNGIYTVTNAGSSTTPWILTRAADADQNAEVTPGLFTFIEEGSTRAGTGWVCNTPAPITIDTTGLSFTQFSTPGTVMGSNLGTGSQLYQGLSGTVLQFRTLATANATNSSLLVESVQGANTVTFNIDQTKITTTGALTAGSISTGFGAISTGNAISTTGTVSGGTVSTSGISLSGSVLSFSGSSGGNLISLPSALASALRISQGSTDLFTVSTSTSGVSIPQGVLSFSPTSGSSTINLTTNLADALGFRDASTAATFLRFITTTGAQLAQFPARIDTTNGTISFSAATGSNRLLLTTNLADALTVTDGTNAFARFVTTTGSRSLQLLQNTTTTNGTITFGAASGSNTLAMPATAVDALSFRQGATTYATFNTSASTIQLLQPTTISGVLTLQSNIVRKTSTVTAATTLTTANHLVSADATAGAFTITLPAVTTSAGLEFIIVKTDSSANIVTVAVSTGDSLDGVANDTITIEQQYERVRLSCPGSVGWLLV